MNIDSLVQEEEMKVQFPDSLQAGSELEDIPGEIPVMEETAGVADTDTEPDMEVSSDGIAELHKGTDKKVIDQIGQLTRNLHDSLRELGYDKRLEKIIEAEVPEAQDKLSYVAMKTEEAADKTLSATEIAMPIQELLSEEAKQLSAKWMEAFEEQKTQPNSEKFKALLIETLSYIDRVPDRAHATNTQLMEIMMAQDFQDLTGQVIKKITQMVQRLEHDLVQLLLANIPPEDRHIAVHTQVIENTGLMNGPVTNPEKNSDTVSSQDQVDDLLASLGF